MLALKYLGAVPATINCRVSLVEVAQHLYRRGINAHGEKTRNIETEFFEDLPDCVNPLPTMH